MGRKETHVIPGRSGGWEVVRSGSRKTDSQHSTQREAERRARDIARNLGGGEVIIHGRDGRIRESDTIPASSQDNSSARPSKDHGDSPSRKAHGHG